MAGTSPAMTVEDPRLTISLGPGQARPCRVKRTASPPSCPALCRASTSCFANSRKAWMPATGAGMTNEGAYIRDIGVRKHAVLWTPMDGHDGGEAAGPSIVMAGLVPAIHVFDPAMRRRRGCPRHRCAKARRPLDG